MSATPHHDLLQPGLFSGSEQTPASRPPASSRDPSSSKRVCFYKSGDRQFSGHRVVINSRTFKTFDALLDALSKKVPLPFGVRTITTPKGTHAVRSLDDLRDGASYVCSDKRRVKPLNLDEVSRRQVPWDTTGPTSSGQQGRRGLIRQLMKKNEVRRAAKLSERIVAVWTPKRLVVYKNRDPSIRRIIVLQRRTAPTFEALLDYLSQVLQFPVGKLYTADGRRVDGLPSLIMCSGIVVAAGNEPFWVGNYSLQGSSQLSQSAISESLGPARTHALQSQKKSSGSRSRSRNFSLSSERYFVDQINKSLNGSLSEDNGHKTGSMDTENNQPLESEEVETTDGVAVKEEKVQFIMPSEDDIEKSFVVNQDGSMTVEMKVHLTVKHEEMIHWTTTLSRICLKSQQRAVCSQLGYSSPETKTHQAKEAMRNNYESSEDYTSTPKSEGRNKAGEDHCGSATSEAMDKPKPALRRLPTPGPRRVRRKEASVENIKVVSQNEVQESTVGAYSYMEHTAEGELTEGYCVVSRSSSSSTRPVPKPRQSSSGEAKHKKTNSSIRSSRTAEVLQLQNNGSEVTETVMRIYESEGVCENYFANTQVSAEKSREFRTNTEEPRKLDSTDSGPRSSSYDCDVDLTRQYTSSDSQNARKKDIFSLSSGQSSSSQKINNNLVSCTNNEKQVRPKSSDKGLVNHEACTKENPGGKRTDNRKTKITPKSVKSKEGSSSSVTISDKKLKGSVPYSLKDLTKSKSPESQSHTASEKKAVSSAESDKTGQKIKKKKKEKQSSESDQNLEKEASQKSAKNVKKSHSVTTRDSSQTDTRRSPIKKKHLDVLPPSHLAPFRMLAKPRSMNECRTKSPEENKELTESISLPALQSSPANVHQYVENWLKKIHPESVPYMDETDPREAETAARPTFWIGSRSADSSEMRSEPELDTAVNECASLEDATAERTVSRPPVEIRCEGEPVETQRVRGFCKSMPSVRIHPAEQESHMRMNRSLGALVTAEPDAEGESSQSTKVNTTSGVKPALRQLCLSIQSIRRTSSLSNLTSFEKKSSSLPDFSSQVASVFGAPSKALLSFLSLMTLKDDISSPGNKDTLSNSGSYPEALQVMQSLEKIANIEDEEALKASLTSLQSSTSSQLKKSWRDFQDRNETEASPPPSPRQSEQEFALEVDSEGEDHDKEHNFGLKELMDELNMSEDLRREISSLLDGEQTSADKAKLTKKPSSKALTDDASENEDATTKDDFLEGEGGFLEDNASQGDITRVEEGVSQPQELHSMDPCPPQPALLRKNLSIEESENVQTVENETLQTDPIKHAPDMEDNVQPSEVKYTDNITCQEEELEVPDPTQNNVEEQEKKEEEEEDTELRSYSLEADGVDVSEHNLEVKYGQDCETEREKGDESGGDDRKTDLDEHKINSEEEDIYEETREFTEQPEAEDINATSEAEHSGIEYELDNNKEAVDADAQHLDLSTDNCTPQKSQDSQDTEFENEGLPLEIHSDCQNISMGEEEEEEEEEEENTNDLEDGKAGALDCTADDADLGTNHNGPIEEEHDNDKESEVSKASEYESLDAKSHHSSMSGEEGEQSDKSEKGSCQSQESESEQKDIQTLQKEGSIEKQSSAEEKYDEEDEESSALGSNKDRDSELEANSPPTPDQESKNCDQSRLESCKSQESDVLQMSEEERFTEKWTSSAGNKDEEADIHENKHCHTLDSEEDCEIEPEQDGATSDQGKTSSCKSQQSEAEHELQTLEEVDATEEKERDDFNSEPEAIDSAISDQEMEHSEQNKEQSYKSQGSEVEHEIQTLEEGDVTEENEEADEHEDEQSDALDSEKDFDAEPEAIDSTVSDQDGEHSDIDKACSWKSHESEDEQEPEPLEEGDATEENDGQIDEAEENYNNQSDRDDKHYDRTKPRSCKSQESDSDMETEAEYPAVSDQVAKLSDQDEARHEASQSQESEDKQGPPTKVQETVCKTTSAEVNNDVMDECVDKQSNALDSDKDEDARNNDSYMQDPEIKHTLWQEPCKNQGTEAHPAQSHDFERVEKADMGNDCYCVHPMEISQELLDFVNLALLSSALTFTYDSNGHMRIEPDRCTITEICDDHYIRRCLPSPNMSDLSDYRPETSDSGGNLSQISSDLYTETADEEVEKRSFYKGNVRQSSKNVKRCDRALDNSLTEINSGSHAKTIDSLSSNSTNSLASTPDSKANDCIQEPASYSNTSGSLNGDSGPVHQIAFHSGVDSSKGILIDKGRWLLKENHLIRKSPPVPMGMYEHVDTTSADTGQDSTSEDAPYPPCGSQHSPLAAISSSELEEMTKPPTPKCTYFNMPHSSDSDPFRDNQSVNGYKAGDVRKSRELKVCPLGETSKTWGKKNGSLPSFASVEFKLPDGKVHPEGGLASGAVEKTARSQSTSSRAAQEEEAAEELNLRCGRHCPIL